MHGAYQSRESPAQVDVYAWTLRHALPTIPIPLKPEDGEVQLDLQQSVSTVYDRARYDNSLDYTAALEPPLSAEDAEWARALLRPA